MALPMMAQLAGAAVNIIIDPILIFGLFGAPELGIYYKIQSFFSFRCWDFSRCCFRLSALILSGGLMLAATTCIIMPSKYEKIYGMSI